MDAAHPGNYAIFYHPAASLTVVFHREPEGFKWERVSAANPAEYPITLPIPIFDQDGQPTGTEWVHTPDLLRVEGYRDDAGTIWTPPTAEAYQKTCQARDQWAERAREAERHLAACVDGLNSGDVHGLIDPIDQAGRFLRTKMGTKS